MKIAITGAGGWLGRELLARLLPLNPNDELLALGSRERDIEICGVSQPIVAWSDGILEDFAPDCVVHAAYLTQEHLKTVDRNGFMDTNQWMCDVVFRAMHSESLKAVLFVSSGASIQKQKNLYGMQKAQHEKQFKRIALETDTHLLIARAWSLSGAFCTKPDQFLFYDLISQALMNDVIRVQSENAVWRKYVDAGEFLYACYLGLLMGEQGSIDSGGSLVEAVDLAREVGKIVAPSKSIVYSHRNNFEDKYFSLTDSMDNLMLKVGISPSTLGQQIATSLQAVLPNR